MGPAMFVELPPGLNHDSRLAEIAEPLSIQAFVAQLAVEAFDEPLCQGLPGGIKAGPTCRSLSQAITRAAVNSVP